MRKLAILMGVAAVAGAMVFASPPASAAPAEHLDWGYHLEGDSTTACPAGTRILRVMRKVINALDGDVPISVEIRGAGVAG